VDVEDVVAAKRFILVDEDGNPRAALMAHRDGLLGLHIMPEPDSTPAISVAVNEQDGRPVVILRRPTADARSEGAIMLTIAEDGHAHIHLADEDGGARTLTTDRRRQV
jgi:hypothetical protein